MKQLKTILFALLVGVSVALTYHVFERAVHHSIDIVWNDWFATEQRRLLVVPLTLLLGLVYFALVHYLAPKNTDNKNEALGAIPAATIRNLLKVLIIGYFSLLAGASLGPEAILVPACVIIGTLLASVALQNDEKAKKLLGAIALAALFTAFFNSFFIGVLSLLLLAKHAKTQLSIILVLLAGLSCGASYLALRLLSASAYATLPPYSWHINLATVVAASFLVIVGYGVCYGLWLSEHISEKVRIRVASQNWWIRAIVATAGLSFLFLIGGYWVEFTGNQYVVPLFRDAASLGIVGLVWIGIVKIAAIGWSKMLGYRGGLIFPTIFVAAVVVAAVQLYATDVNMLYGFIAIMVGAFIANRRLNILF